MRTTSVLEILRKELVGKRLVSVDGWEEGEIINKIELVPDTSYGLFEPVMEIDTDSKFIEIPINSVMEIEPACTMDWDTKICTRTGEICNHVICSHTKNSGTPTQASRHDP